MPLIIGSIGKHRDGLLQRGKAGQAHASDLFRLSWLDMGGHVLGLQASTAEHSGPTTTVMGALWHVARDLL